MLSFKKIWRESESKMVDDKNKALNILKLVLVDEPQKII
jgi:hypothetical protein